MFNPFEGSAEQVRVHLKDLSTDIREDKEYYYYDLIQSINDEEEVVGTVRVPKDTFLMDGELLYCEEDGKPEPSFKKGDAYIRLKIITEEFIKDEEGKYSPELTEKNYKYIHILVTDLLNVPLTEIKVEDKEEGNVVTGIELREEISDDKRLKTYTIILKRIIAVEDVSIYESEDKENNKEEKKSVIYKVKEVTTDSTLQKFEYYKVDLPTELKNPENLTFKQVGENKNIDVGYNGSVPVSVKIVGNKGTEVNSITLNNNKDVVYEVSSKTEIEVTKEGEEDYIQNIEAVQNSDGSITLVVQKENFEDLVFVYGEEEKKEFRYDPKSEKFFEVESGENVEINAEITNNKIVYTINSKTNITIDENKDGPKYVIQNIKEDINSNDYQKHFNIETIEVATPDDIPTELPNKKALIIEAEKKNGITNNIDYIGSDEKKVNIKEGDNVTFEMSEEADELTIEINAIDTNTHYEGENIISNSINGTTKVNAAISNGNLRLNYIEGDEDVQAKSSIPITGKDGIAVKKEYDEQIITVSAKELKDKIEGGVKNPSSLIISDGTTYVSYDGETPKNIYLSEGDNVKISSGQRAENSYEYKIHSSDTLYDFVITTENNSPSEVTGNIKNEELQLRLIETTNIWNENTQQFIDEQKVAAVIPLTGVNRTKVYKNSGANDIFFDTPDYKFGEGLEYDENEDKVNLNFEVDGWTIDAGNISHYCTCFTAADESTKRVTSSKPFTYKNGAMIAVRFSQGNSGNVEIEFEGKTTPVYQGNSEYNAAFSINTVLWLMYYDNGINDFWLLINTPSLQNTKNILSSSSTNHFPSNSIKNGQVHLNHLNDNEVTSSHLIKGEKGLEVTADNGEICITPPDIDVTIENHDNIISLNYGDTLTVDQVSGGNESHEVIVDRLTYKLPDIPTPGGDEHYIAKHILSNSPTGTEPVGQITGTSDKPIYLNLIDGTDDTKHISSLAIYGSGSTNVNTTFSGDGLMIGSTQQKYGVANENELGLIKEGGDISIDDEGIVTVNETEALKGDVYINGMLLQGNDFKTDASSRKNISNFAWCLTKGEETTKEITLSQDYAFRSGLTINVGFSYDNTAEKPRLYITNLGNSAPIYSNGTYISSDALKANLIYTMVFYNGAFHVVNIDTNTKTTISTTRAEGDDFGDKLAVTGFTSSKNTDTDEIIYTPIYKQFSTTDTKTEIDTTKAPQTGTAFITGFESDYYYQNNYLLYTPVYNTLENTLNEIISIDGENKIKVEQNVDDNGIKQLSWTISHDTPNRSNGEHHTIKDYQTPSFGEAFEMPNFYYDNYGHIINYNTASVELPSIYGRFGIDVLKDTTDGNWYAQHSNQVVGGTVGANKITQLNYESNFYVPQFTYDDYGHIRSAKTNTIKLPPIPDYSEIPNTPKALGANRGLNIDSNNNIGHANNQITAGTTVSNSTVSLPNSGKFKIPKITYNNYGHIIKVEEQELTLPPIPNYSEIPGTPDIPEQTRYEGEEGIYVDNKNYKIGHNNSITEGTTISNTTKVLSHNGTFKIPKITYDEHGHVKTATSETLELDIWGKLKKVDFPPMNNNAYDDVTYDDIKEYRTVNFSAYDFSRTDYAIKGQVEIPLLYLLANQVTETNGTVYNKIIGPEDSENLLTIDETLNEPQYFVGCLGINNMFDGSEDGLYYTHYIVAFVKGNDLHIYPFTSATSLSSKKTDKGELRKRRIKQCVAFFS